MSNDTSRLLTAWMVTFIILVGLCCLFGYYMMRRPDAPIEERVDTLIIHDTIAIEKPVFVRSRVTDTMYIYATDTCMIHDSVFVALPKEEKVYEDSTYYAVVSGFRPSLDTLRIYNTEKIITKTIVQTVPEKKRFGIGVQIGYGATVTKGQVYASPYVGVGVSYNLIRF